MGARGPKTDLRELVWQLAQEEEYLHGPSPNPAIRAGAPNVSAIADALECSRASVLRFLAELEDGEDAKPTTDSDQATRRDE